MDSESSTAQSYRLSGKKSTLIEEKTCDLCGFRGKSCVELKKHKRDTHEIINQSTSPPIKKRHKEVKPEVEEKEDMDTDDKFLSEKMDALEIINRKKRKHLITEQDDEERKELSETSTDICPAPRQIFCS